MTVLFRPFPFEASNMQTLVASVECFALMVMFVRSWPRLVRLPRLFVSHSYVAFTIVYTLVFCWAFSNINNIGILTRERVQVLPFVLVLLAVPRPEADRPKARAHSRPPVWRVSPGSGAGGPVPRWPPPHRPRAPQRRPAPRRPRGDRLDHDDHRSRPARRSRRHPGLPGRPAADAGPGAAPGGDLARIGAALDTGQLTDGRTVAELEERAAGLLGVPHVVAVSNCTTGLMLVLQARAWAAAGRW